MFKTVCTALLVCMLLASRTWATDDGAGPRVGFAPPPLRVRKIIQGPSIEDVNWAALKGKVVVLEFWNTDCAPCIAAIPHLNQLSGHFAGERVVFISVCDDNEDYLRKFLKTHPIKGWLAIDGMFNPTKSAFHVIGIPHTVVVGADGKIAAITYPTQLTADSLESLLSDKTTATVAEPTMTTSLRTSVAITAPPAETRQAPSEPIVTISGPYPKPKSGPWGARGWNKSVSFEDFSANKASLPDVLSGFFDVSPRLVLQEAPTPTDLYDVSAIAPRGDIAALRAKLAASIADQLGFLVETTKREMPVYAMQVGPTHGAGLRRAVKRSGGGTKPGGLQLNGVDSEMLASMLEAELDRPVIDESHLSGLWDVDLNWEMSASELASDGHPDPAKVIKAAAEQLGLELKPVVRRTTVVVIRRRDSAAGR